MKPLTNRIRLGAAAAALAGGLALGPGLAPAETDLADGLTGLDAGTTAEQITATLKEQGFEVRGIENDDGMLEAYATKDGKRLEIYVDPATGKITRVKTD